MVNLCETCRHKGKHPLKIPCVDCNDGDNWENERQEIRPQMLPEPVTYYDRETSRIPDRIRVGFEDGSTAIYELRVEQPAPVIIENIKIIRRMKQGYVNKTMRRRNRK